MPIIEKDKIQLTEETSLKSMPISAKHSEAELVILEQENALPNIDRISTPQIMELDAIVDEIKSALGSNIPEVKVKKASADAVNVSSEVQLAEASDRVVLASFENSMGADVAAEIASGIEIARRHRARQEAKASIHLTTQQVDSANSLLEWNSRNYQPSPTILKYRRLFERNPNQLNGPAGVRFLEMQADEICEKTARGEKYPAKP